MECKGKLNFIEVNNWLVYFFKSFDLSTK